MASGNERLGQAHRSLAGHGASAARPDTVCVLVVDGDAGRRRTLAKLLSVEGLAVLVAESGAQAFGLLHAQSVDAVVLDHELPQRGSEQTSERVKADENLRDTLVVMLGDWTDDAARKQALRAGAEELLPRDIDATELALRLRNLTRQRTSHRELARRNASLGQLLHDESQRAAYFDQFSRNLLDASQSLVVVVDAHGMLVAVNQAWQDFMRELGYGLAESGVGRPYRPEQFVSEPAAAHQLHESVRTLAAGVSEGLVIEYPCERPQPRFFRARVTRFRDSLATFILISHEDVTQQRVTRGELADTAKQLEQSRAQMLHTQKLESIGRLVGGVAHDFNNMLTSIICFTRFVVDEMAPEDPRRQDLVEVLRAADSAARLTNQLLTFSRRRPVQPATIDLNASLVSIGRVLRRTLGDSVELVILPLEESAYVTCDPGQFDQLIFNLAIHARDEMLPRGGSITFKLALVSSEQGPQVELVVSDNGRGMTPDALQTAFDPFPAGTTNPASGLSLATSASIVEQASGTIAVESEAGRGTTFRILLPRVADARRSDPVRASAQVQPGLQGTALVVEDQPAILKTMARALKASGMTVLEASSGEDAMAVLRGQAHVPELIVTDMMLPGMSGMHLVEQLRTTSPELRVVYVSGYAGEDPMQNLRLDEKTAFVAKPFTGRQLISRASALLAAAPANQQRR
ncbi:MAG TPA: response regulator [Polyangiales bacterium]|nr:response regulator [Polyangiales bacterium]